MVDRCSTATERFSVDRSFAEVVLVRHGETEWNAEKGIQQEKNNRKSVGNQQKTEKEKTQQVSKCFQEFWMATSTKFEGKILLFLALFQQILKADFSSKILGINNKKQCGNIQVESPSVRARIVESEAILVITWTWE